MLGLGGTSGITIKNCVIENFYYGIKVGESSDVKITDNTISKCGWAAINLGPSATKNTISGNTIMNSDLHGIRLDSSSENTISGNNVENSGNGISLYESSNNNIVSKNILDKGYNSFGIHVAKSSSSNTLSENTISGYTYNGILLHDSANNNIISDNQVSGSGSGTDIKIELSSGNTLSGNKGTVSGA
jgi:parallel beta-helix repeat protein